MIESSLSPTRFLLICHKHAAARISHTHNKCFCGDDSTDLELYCGGSNCDDVVCDKPCTGDDSQICGGVWAMSVYLAGECSIRPDVQKGFPSMWCRFGLNAHLSRTVL